MAPTSTANTGAIKRNAAAEALGKGYSFAKLVLPKLEAQKGRRERQEGAGGVDRGVRVRRQLCHPLQSEASTDTDLDWTDDRAALAGKVEQYFAHTYSG